MTYGDINKLPEKTTCIWNWTTFDLDNKQHRQEFVKFTFTHEVAYELFAKG